MQPIVIIALWVLWFLSWLAGAMLDPRNSTLSVVQRIGYDLVMLIGGFVLLFGFLPDPGFDIRNMVWPTIDGSLGWVLVAVVGIAFCFTWVARFRIGFAFPDSKKYHPQFVETGPYSLLRQPIYFALILAAFATAAAFGRPSSFGAAGLLTIAFAAKILIEERALRDASPDYDDYADRVPMLLPLPHRRREPVAHARAVPSPAASLKNDVPVKAAPVATVAIEPDPIEEILVAKKPVLEKESELEAASEPAAKHQPAAETAAKHDAVAETVIANEEPDHEPKPSSSITTKAVQLSLALDEPEPAAALQALTTETKA